MIKVKQGGPPVRANNWIMHYVIFDGTTAYIGDESDINNDVEVVGESENIQRAQEIADNYNEEILALRF